jgi:hypothetical protein
MRRREREVEKVVREVEGVRRGRKREAKKEGRERRGRGYLVLLRQG